MARPHIQIRTMTIAGFDSELNIPCVNVGNAPIRVAADMSYLKALLTSHVRRGTVFIYRRDLEAWVMYHNIHEAIASQDHTLVGYGLRHMLPRSELQRLDDMILNIDGAREIMRRYREISEDEIRTALTRLGKAANEYRMPRVLEKVRARDWLVRASSYMTAPNRPNPGSGHGRNPGAAMAVTLPTRAALRTRQASIRSAIGPRIAYREMALFAERTFCLAVFGRLANLLTPVHASACLQLSAHVGLHEMDIVSWHTLISDLRRIATGLRGLVLPAPYARFTLRVTNELERAAIELEARNFPVARHQIDVVMRSLDFLTIAERIADAKLALCNLHRDTSLPYEDAITAAMSICLTIYGLTCLLDDNGFSNPTSTDIRVVLEDALLHVKAYRIDDARASLTVAARMIG